MNRHELAKILAPELKLTENKSEKLIIAFCDTIAEALSSGKRVVYSNFGSFYTVHYPSKVIYHPVLGKQKKMVMLPTDAVKWMPSENIKDMVDRAVITEHATSYGSAKKLFQAKREAGFSDVKAVEVSKSEMEALKRSPKNIIDDEVVEIPIKVIRKNPPKEEEENAEITPFHDRKAGISFVDLSQISIPKEVLFLVPKELANRAKIIPIDLQDEVIVLGMTDPHDTETIEEVKRLLHKKVSPKLISENDLAQILKIYEDNLVEEDTQIEPPEPINVQKNAPVGRVLSLILKRAIRERAQAIHFDPIGKDLAINFRIGEQLIFKTKLPKSIAKELVRRLKDFARVDLKSTAPYQADFDYEIEGENEVFSVSGMPLAEGEKIVINTRTKVRSLKAIENLDLRKSDFEAIKAALGKKGVTVVVSEIEEERKTLLYAFAEYSKRLHPNVLTLENHLDLDLPRINQALLNETKGFTLQNALCALSNLDQDTIVIDEINDSECAERAFLLSENRSVIFGLNAKNAFTTIETLNEFVSGKILADRLNLVIAAKSLPRICSTCQTTAKPETSQIRQIKEQIALLSNEERARLKRIGAHFYSGRGCKDCDKSGHQGEIELFEILDLNEKLSSLIENNKGLAEIEKEARKSGFISLTQDGIGKALIGLITVKDIFEL